MKILQIIVKKRNYMCGKCKVTTYLFIPLRFLLHHLISTSLTTPRKHDIFAVHHHGFVCCLVDGREIQYIGIYLNFLLELLVYLTFKKTRAICR